MRPLLLVLTLAFFASCGNETPHNEKQEHGATNTVTADTVAKTNPYKDATVEVVTYDNAKSGGGQKGFGYDITIDGKTYIHQPNIPALPGNDGFATEEKAKKAGELVAYKVKNNIMPPSVTEHELDSVGALK